MALPGEQAILNTAGLSHDALAYNAGHQKLQEIREKAADRLRGTLQHLHDGTIATSDLSRESKKALAEVRTAAPNERLLGLLGKMAVMAQFETEPMNRPGDMVLPGFGSIGGNRAYSAKKLLKLPLTLSLSI